MFTIEIIKDINVEMPANSAVYYKQNRLKQLRAFCYTAKYGSISRAAERLYLSQPSVSLQIQALERELNTTLFERRGPIIKLTPQGRTLLKLGQPLVQGMDSLGESFAARCGSLESGLLNIAAGESTILYILPEPIKQFTQAHSGVSLKLHNVTGRDGIAMLRADEVDFAVGTMLETPEDMIYQPVFTYDPVLITPIGHPLSQRHNVELKHICPYGLILPPRHLSTWRLVEMIFQQHGLSYTVALEAGGWEVIKKYVKLGMGISIVTDICLSDTDTVERIPLKKYFPTRSYGIVMRRGKYLSPQAKRFIQMMAPGVLEKDEFAESQTDVA